MEQSLQARSSGGRARWTDEDQRRAEGLRARGLSYEAIGQELGFSKHTTRCRLDPVARERTAEVRRRHYESHQDVIRERARRAYWANPEPERERSRRYQAENRAERRDYDRRWREANREWVRERGRVYDRRWREANPERVREMARIRGRRWYKANPRRSHSKVYRWRDQHPAAWREIARRRYAAKKSAGAKALLPIDLDQIQQRHALFGGRCAYCGAADRITADHVFALSAGGLDEAANIVPACRSCNSSKNHRPVEDWYRRQPFFTETRWRKIQRHCPGVAAGQLPLALGLSVVA